MKMNKTRCRSVRVGKDGYRTGRSSERSARPPPGDAPEVTRKLGGAAFGVHAAHASTAVERVSDQRGAVISIVGGAVLVVHDETYRSGRIRGAADHRVGRRLPRAHGPTWSRPAHRVPRAVRQAQGGGPRVEVDPYAMPRLTHVAGVMSRATTRCTGRGLR